MHLFNGDRHIVQWKIIHDFKPTEYLSQADSVDCLGGLYVAKIHSFIHSPLIPLSAWWLVAVWFNVTSSTTLLMHTDLGNNMLQQAEPLPSVTSNKLPKIGEWTRIEMTHEKVDGKYFLSLSVGGKDWGREEVTNTELGRLSDVTVCTGLGQYTQSGFIRRLVVLQK